MKRKLTFLLLIGSLTFGLTACGGQKEETPDPPKTTQTTTEENDSDKKEEEPEKTELTLDGLEQYLLEKKVLSGEKTEAEASLIGAESGFKYADSNAEIYEYDEKSEAYKQLSQNGSIQVQGFEGYSISPVAVNGPFVLISSMDETLSDDLINAFKSYGK